MGPSSYFKQPPKWRSRRYKARPTLGQVRLGGRPATAWGKPGRRWGKGSKRRLGWRWWLKWGLGLIACLILLLGAAVLWYSRDLPDPNRLIDRSIAQTTKLYDSTGQTVLYEIHGDESRSMVTLDEIPAFVQQATIAAEDKDFYHHGGVSLKGTIRAIVVDIVTGKKEQGGSTLTQQLVKNAILTNEKQFSRKLKEIILSWRIEQVFSKDQILQMYLNEIPYGGSSYGIQSAAQSYFGKDVGQLTLAEAAALAALPKAPTLLSPYTSSGLQALLARQQYILDGMVEAGNITADQAAAAKTQKLTFVPRRAAIKAPHFSMWVYSQLVEKYGQRLVEEGGLKVITTLDMNLQAAAEQAVDDQVANNKKKFQANNAALVSIDVPTGQIKAMVGSADFFDEEIDGQVNVALAPRQPGSSFKPVVYSSAFDLGYSPQTVVFDLETDFPTDQGIYHPHNYDLKEHGPVTLRQALAGSLNVPAVKVLYLTGIDRVLDLAQKLGYTTLNDRSRFGLSLVLGGGEVSVLEHTNAYATLAREGNFVPPASILRVESSDGRVLEEWQQSPDQGVIRPEVAKTVTDILSDNGARAFIFGATNYLTLLDRPVAAKTGTTNNYHDAWTLGYTPQLATGVWVGNSDNTTMKRGADGSVVAAPIWQKFMKLAHQNLPVATFSPPPPAFNISSKPMLNGQWDGGVTVALDRRSNTLANESTPPEFVEERTYRQVHNILYWVDKNNPLGGMPTNPQQDPAYALWEAPVEKWLKQKGITNELLPTFSPPPTNNSLSIKINNPSTNQVINSSDLFIEAAVDTNQQNSLVNSWRLFIDGQAYGNSSDGKFNVSLSASLVDGQHVVSVTAVDQAGVAATANQVIDIQRNNPITTTWDTSAQLNLNSPLVLSLKTPNTSLKQVDFYVRPPAGNQRWLGLATPASDSQGWSLAWPGATMAGDYIFIASLTDSNNNQWLGGAWVVRAQ